MTKLHISWSDAIWQLPLLSLMLLINQDQYNQDQNMITLGDKELIDSLPKSR